MNTKKTKQARSFHRTSVELFVLALQQIQMGVFGAAAMAHEAAEEMADAAAELVFIADLTP